MKQEYLDIIKEKNGWFFDKDFKCNLVLTDDLDSILSALLLMQYRPEWHIGFFFDFNTGMYSEAWCDESLPLVGVDLSAIDMKCISNHVTALDEDDYVNLKDINLNYIGKKITVSNYHSKYNLNTLCLVYSLLGLHPQSNDESALLLLPDSSFQAHYANPSYKDSYIQKQILDIMDLNELQALMDKTEKNKFYEAQDYYRIRSKFDVTDKGIESIQQVDLEEMCEILGIDKGLLQELQGLFYLQQRYKGYTDLACKRYDKSKLFSFAVVSKNKVKFSKLEVLKDE